MILKILSNYTRNTRKQKDEKKHELKVLYCVGRVTKDKVRHIIIKLNDMAAKNRLFKLKNLKLLHNDNETNIYINPDRTVLQLKAYERLKEEIKEMRHNAEQNHLNIRYVIRNNKIIERKKSALSFQYPGALGLV